MASAVHAAGSGTSSWSSDPADDSSWQIALDSVEEGKFEEALPSLQKIVQENPKNADAWNYIGFCRRNLGQLSLAHEAYSQALQINPQHRGALEYLGELYLLEDNLAMARKQLEKLDSACFFGCSEYRDLDAKISAYEKSR